MHHLEETIQQLEAKNAELKQTSTLSEINHIELKESVCSSFNHLINFFAFSLS